MLFIELFNVKFSRLSGEYFKSSSLKSLLELFNISLAISVIILELNKRQILEKSLFEEYE